LATPDQAPPDQAPPARPAALSPLAQRFVSTVVGVPIVAAVCVWGATPFVLFAVALAVIARSEITRAYRRLDIRPNFLLSLIGALLPAAVLLLPLPWTTGTPGAPLTFLLILACGLIAASLLETGAASHAGSTIQTGRNMAYGLLCGAYVSLFTGVALLRVIPWRFPEGATLLFPFVTGGAALVLVTMASTMASDAGAFFAGRWLGRHKLAVGLSPNKTTEGLAGGMIASILVGSGAGWTLLGSVGFGLLVGIAAAVLGPMGDLFKSALKREIGIKDFGSIIPGHGGVLDRFDSLLFTAPVVVLMARTFGPH